VEHPGHDIDLVGAIRSGDRKAEEELVSRYRRGLSMILSSSDSAVREDLLQETFRLAIAKIRAGEVREPEKLPGFMCSLARNLAIGHRRRAKPSGPLPDALPAGEPSPLEEFLNGERARIVRQLLSEMEPERDREVLYRFYLDEEAKESICTSLGLSSLHFNRVLYRARERFRALWSARNVPGD
jgi:RNA polymerase sigma-70 factor (ECF subfamily)